MSDVNSFHTEIIDLPSKGWFYPEDHPLSSGRVELYYMTAKHEDILTSRNLIQRGVVIDKLLQALIVDKTINYNDLFLGDKGAIMIASRILGYGKEYNVNIDCPQCYTTINSVVDLQEIGDLESELFVDDFRNKNEFPFTLPLTKQTVTFKILTHADESKITAELDGLRKIHAGADSIVPEVTVRLRHSITSVDGNSDGEHIRNAVENMAARDARALREYMKRVVPNIDLTTPFICSTCNYEGRVEIPMDINFFWPRS